MENTRFVLSEKSSSVFHFDRKSLTVMKTRVGNTFPLSLPYGYLKMSTRDGPSHGLGQVDSDLESEQGLNLFLLAERRLKILFKCALKIPEKSALWCFIHKSKHFNIELTNRSSLAPKNFNRVESLSTTHVSFLL